jgi:hypothetical protein
MDHRRAGELAPLPPDERVREEQLHLGFTPLTCHACGSEVEVRKAGPAQTSIQWTCGVRCPQPDGSPSGPNARTCPLLAGAIAAAVVDGRIAVGDAAWGAGSDDVQ